MLTCSSCSTTDSTPASTALLDRMLHHAVVIPIEGNSYRLREHAALIPETMQARHSLLDPMASQPVKRRPGRPRKELSDPYMD
jgi:hypothetical protein